MTGTVTNSTRWKTEVIVRGWSQHKFDGDKLLVAPHPSGVVGSEPPSVGTWLSLVEHSLGVRGVGSSNLPVPTNTSLFLSLRSKRLEV